jgi:hypothetical protein
LNPLQIIIIIIITTTTTTTTINPYTGLERPLGFKVEAPRISRQLANEGGKFTALCTGRHYPHKTPLAITC